MSALSMESWMQFGQYGGADDDANIAATRLAYNKAFAGAGYLIGNENATQGWLVRADPTNPLRNSLVFSAPIANRAVSAIRKALAVYGDTVIGGFSLLLPSAWMPWPPEEYVAGMVVTIGPMAEAMPLLNLSTAAYPTELFRVRMDGRIAYGTEVQSSRKIEAGKMAFLEYRITPTETRVWLDDVLVLQKNMTLHPEAITLGIASWQAYGGGTGIVGGAARWAVSNYYALREDAVEPNQRLGPTTRVIGTRPASDNFTQFVRPSGYASNAQVVAQPFNPDGNAFLRTDTIGAQDVYNAGVDSGVSTAGMIHAISVKAIAQNMEAVPHELMPMVVSNGTAAGTPTLLSPALSMFTSIIPLDPNTGEKWTPGDASEVKFGIKLES